MKIFLVVVAILAVLAGGAIYLSRGKAVKEETPVAGSNVSIVDGKQVIVINAKGGYSPRTTLAKANMPTVIKVETQGTFDCSSGLSIPGIGYRINLPPTGETLVEVPAQPAGATLRGQCSMGMYNFTIDFK